MRREKKYHYLYKTTNIINEKYYIGMHSTDNLSDGYLGSGKRLKYAIKKYGVDNFKFEIIKFFDSRASLKAAEANLINESLLLDPLCLNLMVGGGGGFISAEQQRHRSTCGAMAHNERLKNDVEYLKAFKLRVSLLLKRTHKEGKLRYDNFTGKKHTEESKKKIGSKNRIKQKGELNSQFGTCWITKSGENIKIKKIELEYYLYLGWVKGRVKNLKNEDL